MRCFAPLHVQTVWGGFFVCVVPLAVLPGLEAWLAESPREEKACFTGCSEAGGATNQRGIFAILF